MKASPLKDPMFEFKKNLNARKEKEVAEKESRILDLQRKIKQKDEEFVEENKKLREINKELQDELKKICNEEYQHEILHSGLTNAAVPVQSGNGN